MSIKTSSVVVVPTAQLDRFTTVCTHTCAFVCLTYLLISICKQRKQCNYFQITLKLVYVKLGKRKCFIFVAVATTNISLHVLLQIPSSNCGYLTSSLVFFPQHLRWFVIDQLVESAVDCDVKC